ncbi:MAG TPA: OmpA family protein [Thermoanaerobaculia bacterium]|nr:OmpA family protein [Thermoanaerobaculia bacterium]
MRLNLRRSMAVGAVVLGLSLTGSAGAQSQSDREKMKAQSELSMAEAAVASAEVAGARVLAKTLYDESVAQIRQARANWNDSKHEVREDATLRAVEARYAARAAEAQASLIGANTEIRNLRTDIGNFGGTAVAVTLYDPPPTISRGVTSLERVIVAENAVRVAREVGGDQGALADLQSATGTLKTARSLAKNQKQSESADHLAYIAEMQARRAEYIARRNAIAPQLANLRLDRTRMAQQIADTQARAEQERRLTAERQAADLRRQLEAESTNRQAEQAELERLRLQVATSEQELRNRFEEDRAARVAAETSYDQLMRRYQDSLVEGSATSIEAEQLRRQLEDQSLTLRSLQERERLSETSMTNQIDTLQRELDRERTGGRLTADVLSQREQELTRQRVDLQRMQTEREANEQRRLEAERVHTATMAELTKAREELAKRDAVNRDRIESMQAELAKLAETRSTDRGFIVTLPGLFFDSGKSVLKPGAKNTLAKIATQLQTNPDARIEIEGHTDSVGSDAMNQALSEKRAAAVRDYLASHGLPAVRITISGQGESTPVASNDTAAGRQQNRRVELVIAPASQVSSQ